MASAVGETAYVAPLPVDIVVLDCCDAWEVVDLEWRRQPKFIPWTVAGGGANPAATAVLKLATKLSNERAEALEDAGNKAYKAAQQAIKYATNPSDKAGDTLAYMGEAAVGSEEDAVDEQKKVVDAVEAAIAKCETAVQEWQQWVEQTDEWKLQSAATGIGTLTRLARAIATVRDAASAIGTELEHIMSAADIHDLANPPEAASMLEMLDEALPEANLDDILPDGTWSLAHGENVAEALNKVFGPGGDTFTTLNRKLEHLPVPPSHYFLIVTKDDDSKLLYIGKTTNLCGRFNDGHKCLAKLNHPAYDGWSKRIVVTGCLVNGVPLAIGANMAALFGVDGLSAADVVSAIEMGMITFHKPAFNDECTGGLPATGKPADLVRAKRLGVRDVLCAPQIVNEPSQGELERLKALRILTMV